LGSQNGEEMVIDVVYKCEKGSQNGEEMVIDVVYKCEKHKEIFRQIMVNK